MKSSQKFPFERARRITAAEAESARDAIAEKLGGERPKRPGRPTKAAHEKKVPTTLRLSPAVRIWAERGAKVQGVGYQTFINSTLEKLASLSQWSVKALTGSSTKTKRSSASRKKRLS